METYQALHTLLEQNAWPDFNAAPVNYYYDRMIGSWLLQLMDNSLSDEQLRAVQREDVTRIILLLFRDLFRHHSKLLRPAVANADWVETFFEDVARHLGLAEEAIKDNGRAYSIDLDDLQNCEWAKSLGIPGCPRRSCSSAIAHRHGRHEFGSTGTLKTLVAILK